MDPHDYTRAVGILVEFGKLQKELQDILRTERSGGRLEQLEHMLRDLRKLIEEDFDSVFRAALARVNLRNEVYRFMRAIDGDTIEVKPPDELQAWMKDVHIRLYGIDAPEINEQLGRTYADILRDLCSSVAGGKLMIVWERERPGTEYADYPRTSFERGVGNVFIAMGEKVLYLNSLLALLPHTTTKRGKRDLIRGRRHLGEVGHFHNARCPVIMPPAVKSVLSKHSLYIDEGFPACLYLFPRELATESSPIAVWGIIRQAIENYACLFSVTLDIAGEHLEGLLNSRTVSPFDIPLMFVSKWKEMAVS